MPLLITIALCGPSERHLHRTCCPMALQRSPKFRLRFKQPCPPRKDKCQSREHIARKAAVSEGLVPKARRPFALFLKEKSILKPGSSRLQYQKEMKKLGRAWKALLPAEKQQYKLKCQEEFLQQRAAMKAQGLPLRKEARGEPEQRKSAPPQQLQQRTKNRAKQLISKIDDFEVLPDREPLGEGSYGTVLASMGPHGSMCAVKVYKCSKSMVDFKQELLVLNLIRDRLEPVKQLLFPVFLKADESKKPFPFVALEFGGPSLLQVLQESGALDEQSMLCLSSQVKAALQALHGLGVLHLDVKPANILWSTQTFRMKLADFGMSEMMESVQAAQLRYSEYVTALYRPPELWHASRKEICKHLKPSVDIWSYGCVLFECVTGRCLMRPCPAAQAGDASSMVRLWCSSWRILSSSRHCSSKLGAAQSLYLRLSKAGSWVFTILTALALNPEPSSRKWDGVRWL